MAAVSALLVVSTVEGFGPIGYSWSNHNMKPVVSLPSPTLMMSCQLTYRCPHGRSVSSLSASAKIWIFQSVISQLANTEIEPDGPITIWLCSATPNVCEAEQILADRHVAKFAARYIKPGEKVPSKLLDLRQSQLNTWLVTLSKSGLETMPKVWRDDYLNLHACLYAQA